MKRIVKSLGALILAFGMCGCDGTTPQSVSEISSQVKEGAEKAQEIIDQKAEELGLSQDDELVIKAKEIASQAQEIFEQRAKEAGLYEYEEKIAEIKEKAENIASKDVSLNTDTEALFSYLGTDPKTLLGQLVDNSGMFDSDIKSYEEIYERYEKKLREETPKLIEEYNAEAARDGSEAALKENLSARIAKLAAINVEGNMALAMFKNSENNSSAEDYQEWAKKLYSVYEEEALKLSQSYQEAILPAD